MGKLALLGGPKTIPTPFPDYNPIGREEVDAAKSVVESGLLSGFFGSWNDRFYGGPQVKAFERAWADAFGVRHAISFNSWTSGLVAAVGALGVEPGDEVIVSPWTMAASATAILVWNAIPVFADIEPDTFNLDPVSVEKNITPRTKAIMVPDIFGQAANLDALMEIAKKHKLKVIEDAAQAPYARYGGKFVGTVGDIGGYSLNYHKHIHTGEGGMAVTDDAALAERMMLIRNHGEAVVGPKGVENITNIVGFNFRMGEIEAAMGLAQLRKLPALSAQRSDSGARLSAGLGGLNGLGLPLVRERCTHVFYIYPMIFDREKTGVSRERIIEALQAEGVTWIYPGYQLIHLLPMYQKKIAYGSRGFPWTPNIYSGSVRYDHGICPVAERLHERDLVCLQICQHDYTDDEVDRVVEAFRKVWAHLPELA